MSSAPLYIALLILQPFRHFTYVTTHSPTLPQLYLRHSSFFNPSVSLPTSQLILQPLRHFTYVTTHSPTLPSLYLRHSSFFNPSVASLTSQFILHPSFASPTSQALQLIHLESQQSSFSNLSVSSPTSQLILQPFIRFTYVTAHYPTLPLLHLRHSSLSNPSFASPTSQAHHLTLMMPGAWDIGYKQPFINCQWKSATHFVYF